MEVNHEQSRTTNVSYPQSTGQPTLTAIICNYNHGRYVSRAIEAMLAQSRPADEFLIVDDGSTDDSAAIIRSWAERHPEIHFLQNERNIGFHASLQRALEAATSDYIYSGAADDRVLPDFFAGVMKLAKEHPVVGIISGQVITVDAAGRHLSLGQLSKIRDAVYLDPRAYLEQVLKVEPATHSLSGATIFRRDALTEVGGHRAELGSWGDTFAIQAIALKHGFCYWPHPAMEWTVLPNSLSQTTRSDPMRAWRMVDRAAGLMRSAQFRDRFPLDYVANWVRAYRRTIAHDELQAAIEGHQAVQACCQRVAASSNLPTRLLIEVLRWSMKATYSVTFQIMRYCTLRRLRRLAASDDA